MPRFLTPSFRLLVLLLVLSVITRILTRVEAQPLSNSDSPPTNAVQQGNNSGNNPDKKAPTASDVELVERLHAARKEYENSLKALYEHYARVGDRQRLKWAEDELLGYHLLFKPSYNLDVKDVPPPSLRAEQNIPAANELYRAAMAYKDRGFGTEYVLNQRRAEILLREILEKYPNSDKIADVAYQLGELYESRAFRQYDRAARYFERAYQWIKGGRTDARLRAAIIYDRYLNDRNKAIQLYREHIAHDTDPDRIRQAERRLAELIGSK
jgi:tetratricopeptide (TPR) repeat protein